MGIRLTIPHLSIDSFELLNLDGGNGNHCTHIGGKANYKTDLLSFTIFLLLKKGQRFCLINSTLLEVFSLRESFGLHHQAFP